MGKLLEVKNLKTQFKTEGGLVKAVDDVSYYIDEQEIVGVVGESGCGKSVSQLSVMRLINPPSDCSFHVRWFMAIPECSYVIPPLRDVGNGHRVACIRV